MPQEGPKKRQGRPPSYSPADLLKSQRGRATLDSVASLLGAPNIFQAGRGRMPEGANGVFFNEHLLNTITGGDLPGRPANQILLDENDPGHTYDEAVYVAAHEGEHARDWYDANPLQKTWKNFQHGGAYLLSKLLPGISIESPVERTAEIGAESLDFVRRINAMSPEPSDEWQELTRDENGVLQPRFGGLDSAIRQVQSIATNGVPQSSSYGYELNGDAMLKRIQDIARHPNNRGSMIRRALLGAGYELR